MHEGFEPTDENFDKLRSIISRILDVSVTVKELKRESGVTMSVAALYRFKSGETRRPNVNECQKLWEYSKNKYPELFIYGSNEHNIKDTNDRLYIESKYYFNIKESRIEKFRRSFCGYYTTYFMSEIFYSDRMVVSSLWSISSSEFDSLKIEEIQKYTGGFGLSEMSERYEGICLPKGGKYIFVLRRQFEDSPKFYFIDDYNINHIDNKVDYMSGFMINQTSRFKGFFQSNFYAVRINDKNTAKIDIVEKDELNNSKRKHIYNWIFPNG